LLIGAIKRKRIEDVQGAKSKLLGALSWGYTILWARKEGVRKKLLENFTFISLCGTKKRTKEKPPLAFRVPTEVGIPSPGT